MTPRLNALITGGVLLGFALMASTVPGATAQDATPVAAVGAAQAATPVAAVSTVVPRPVHIHSGDCVNLGEIVAPLTDLAAPVGEGSGQSVEATPAESSFTTVPLALDAILGADHAVNVHLSTAQIDTYLACGEIGGVLDVNGALIIGLRESTNSGYAGIAFLQPAIDGVSTDVSVFIAPGFGAAG